VGFPSLLQGNAAGRASDDQDAARARIHRPTTGEGPLDHTAGQSSAAAGPRNVSGIGRATVELWCWDEREATPRDECEPSRGSRDPFALSREGRVPLQAPRDATPTRLP